MTVPLLPCTSIDAFEPADSYGNRIVQVPDVGVVHEAFAAGQAGCRTGQRGDHGDSHGDVAQAELRAIPLTAEERTQVAETLRSLEDLT